MGEDSTNGSRTTRAATARPRMSMATSSPKVSAGSTRARATPARRVGEYVPEVVSPTAPPSAPRHGHVRAWHPPALEEKPAQRTPAALRPLGDERCPPGELGLVPPDRPGEPCLDRRDGVREVLAVEGVAHLGAQRVAGPEPAGRRTRGHGRPQLGEDFHGKDHLVPVLPRVARAAHQDRGAGELGGGERHVGEVLIGAQKGQADHHLATRGTLDREDPLSVVAVLDLHFGGQPGSEGVAHRCGVGGVGHHSQLVGPKSVDDEVVHHPAGRVAEHRVLGLPRADPVEVVGQDPVQRSTRPRAGHDELAHVRDVEHADGCAHGRVLGDHAGRVLDGHLPPAEVGHPGARGTVRLGEGGPAQGHARSLRRCAEPRARSCRSGHSLGPPTATVRPLASNPLMKARR